MALSFKNYSVKNGELIALVESSEKIPIESEGDSSLSPTVKQQWSSVPSLNFESGSESREVSGKGSLTGKSLEQCRNLPLKVDSLPDVTDTESPHNYPSEKPCDLLAQLDKEKGEAVALSSVDLYPNLCFDDNGNPLQMQRPEKLSDKKNVVSRGENQGPSECPLTTSSTSDTTKSPKESGKTDGNSPKYFINAQSLSEDTFPLSPAQNYSSLELQRLIEMNAPAPEASTSDHKVEETPKISPESTEALESTFIRGRVPVSKSFPDIVQTTMSSGSEDDDAPCENENPEDPSLEMHPGGVCNLADSYVADSLEELCDADKLNEDGDSEPEQREIPGNFPMKSHFPNSFLPSYLMTDSQMSGILSEKPPEAWIIDFNTLSMDSEGLQSTSSKARSSTGGSNPSSLSFFVNIDDMGNPEHDNLRQETETPDKKIFSMFVDIGNNAKSDEKRAGASVMTNSGSSKIPKSAPQPQVVNKPVVNVMERSTGSMSSSLTRKFPSPIFQHKAATEAARKAAKLELLEKEKAEREAACMRESHLHKGGVECSSNRSSLHVANELFESSFAGSLLSSMENSAPGELEICQGGPCFKLGKDLLRMFQDGINTDVNISVHGRVVKAHKCILASRSQYFAAILSGHWVEKAGNTINLDGFSYNVVQFTMYHIYSGTNEIPETIDLLELAALTDLLGLEGLRENISQTIRVKFCHNFHRPCTNCIAGVLECFPIALAYGMDELHRKMTKWVCKHFVRIWPTKAFANLGDELIEKCLRYNANHLSVDNILDHTLGCDQLVSTMPTVRWTETIFSIVNQLLEACVQFIGENFCGVVQSQKFLLFGKGQTWNISRIEGTFTQALALLKPDEACLSHTALTQLIDLGKHKLDEVEWSTVFMDFLCALRAEIEQFLLANAGKAVLCKGWEQLGNDVKKRICNTSFMGHDKYGNKASKPLVSPVSHDKPTRTVNKSAGSRHSRNQSKPTVSIEPSSTTTNNVTTVAAATKVASVRPMRSEQNVFANVASNVTTTTAATIGVSTASVSRNGIVNRRPMSATNARQGMTSSPNTVTNVTTTTAPRAPVSRAASMQHERERSFTSLRSTTGGTSSNCGSAARSPLKPLTPSTPSKPSPLAGMPSRAGRAASRKPVPEPPPPVQPPPKSFMTNSERAAAVSKPILKPRKYPPISNVVVPSQSSPRPTLAQTTRYSSLGGPASARSGTPNTTYSGRSSLSNCSEKPDRFADVTKARSAPVGQGRTKSTFVSSTREASGFAKRTAYGYGSGNKNETVGSPIPARRLIRSRAGSVAGTATQKNYTTTNYSSDDLSSSYNAKDNVMSRSTIETDSGEVKMRTLAEIGRSSTFSKDEPTILGKMDGIDGSTFSLEICP